MPENNPNIEHQPSERTPEDLAALELARQELQKDANEVLVEKETQPQVPKSSFQPYPDSSHAEQTAKILEFKPKAETEVHQEIPGMTLPKEIKTEDQKRKALDQLMNSTPDTTQAGVANELQAEMDQLISEPTSEELKEAA